MEPHPCRPALHPASQLSIRSLRSPRAESLARRAESPRRGGVEAILAGINEQVAWLDLQVAALAAEMLKTVGAVGLVQDLARTTEARVQALEVSRGMENG